MLSAEQLVRRLIALIPPRGLHLTNFHGLLAPHAQARQSVAPVPVAPRPPAPTPRKSQAQRPRIDWATLLARTFGCDVWKCPCGGQRRVVALVTNRHTAEEMLKNLGLLHATPPLPVAQAPPQLPLLPQSH